MGIASINTNNFIQANNANVPTTEFTGEATEILVENDLCACIERGSWSGLYSSFEFLKENNLNKYRIVLTKYSSDGKYFFVHYHSYSNAVLSHELYKIVDGEYIKMPSLADMWFATGNDLTHVLFTDTHFFIGYAYAGNGGKINCYTISESGFSLVSTINVSEINSSLLNSEYDNWTSAGIFAYGENSFAFAMKGRSKSSGVLFTTGFTRFHLEGNSIVLDTFQVVSLNASSNDARMSCVQLEQPEQFVMYTGGLSVTKMQVHKCDLVTGGNILTNEYTRKCPLSVAYNNNVFCEQEGLGVNYAFYRFSGTSYVQLNTMNIVVPANALSYSNSTMAFSSDGKFLFVACNRTNEYLKMIEIDRNIISNWKVTNFKLPSGTQLVSTICFSPDDTTIATGDDYYTGISRADVRLYKTNLIPIIYKTSYKNMPHDYFVNNYKGIGFLRENRKIGEMGVVDMFDFTKK